MYLWANIRGQRAEGFIYGKRWIQGHGEAFHYPANRYYHGSPSRIDSYVRRCLVRGNVFPCCVYPFEEGWDVSGGPYLDARLGSTSLLYAAPDRWPPSHRLYHGRLLASLPALFAAPLLIGSITWSPSHTMVLGGVPVSNIPTSADVRDSYSWWWFQFWAICRIRAAGSASTAWNIDATSDLGLMKCIVAPAKQLSPNSTLNNITLPYFFVHSLTWLSDILQITQPNLTWAIDPAGGLMNASSIYNPLQHVTPTLAIIPDEPYHEAIWNQTTQRYMFPEPSKVETHSVCCLPTSHFCRGHGSS